jgi:predicted transcriptional regulator
LSRCEMSAPRSPVEIAYEIMKHIKDNGGASRWDLIKILGNTRQFHHWVTDFLVQDGFLKEHNDGNSYTYTLTESGAMLYRLLQKGNVMSSIFKLGGRRLRRD